MNKIIFKCINKIDKKENKILVQNKKDSVIKQKFKDKVPDKLQSLLEDGFVKAFDLIFSKGSIIIEKTFDKENLIIEHEANNFVLDKKESKKTIRRMDKPAIKSNLINHTATTTTGLGLGLLGMGLPDIPLLVGTILKGIYQISLSYGFDYTTDKEKIYILRLINVALTNGEEKIEFNELLESNIDNNVELSDEIKQTAKIMANELLVEKFIQGIPIIGVVGAYTNWATYRKVSKLSVIKYKKRYLKKRMNK